MPMASTRLAPHETIDLHEVLVAKTTGLAKLKDAVPKIENPELKQLVLHTIRVTEQHIAEIIHLLQYRAILP
ncbi:hypothetical protein SD70_07235 [Gordoniibacillus kamchatkensis]|uniref:Spore coat protein n=2 Tax=Gordoniibacillus kamchatkensis TaxID=1590651 RepID=A0ABR5ALS0_9BACL|nr:hypothetical protein SD70_07235 [Paenibacillus sp. VKM B-2647]